MLGDALPELCSFREFHRCVYLAANQELSEKLLLRTPKVAHVHRVLLELGGMLELLPSDLARTCLQQTYDYSEGCLPE